MFDVYFILKNIKFCCFGVFLDHIQQCSGITPGRPKLTVIRSEGSNLVGCLPTKIGQIGYLFFACVSVGFNPQQPIRSRAPPGVPSTKRKKGFSKTIMISFGVITVKNQLYPALLRILLLDTPVFLLNKFPQIKVSLRSSQTQYHCVL